MHVAYRTAGSCDDDVGRRLDEDLDNPFQLSRSRCTARILGQALLDDTVR